jgi:branched-chain amino acid transport system substrate-binding protein
LQQRIRARLGREPDAFAFLAYDALWVATLAYVETGGADQPEGLKKALTQTAASYFGASGWTTLNEAGDRAFGNFDFWAVREENGSFQWQRVAQYLGSSGTVLRLEEAGE